MPLIQDLNEVVELSGESIARLEVFANHIPDEWVRIAAALSDKVDLFSGGPSLPVNRNAAPLKWRALC